MKEPKQITNVAVFLATVAPYVDGKQEKGYRQTNRKTAYGIAIDAETLCRIGRSMNRHAENLCNIPDYQAKFDKAFSRLEVQAEKIAAEYGFTVYTQSDPRGACLRIGSETGMACL